MRFTAGFLAIAAAVSSALAKIQLTNSAYDVVAGEPFTITWSGAADSSSVTINLKNGASTNLKTVENLASGVSGTSFTWTPSTSLATDTYAFEITDGSTTNYSPQFVFSGSAASSSPTTTSSSISTTLSSLTITSTTTSTPNSSVTSSSSSSTTGSNSTAKSTMKTATKTSSPTASSTDSTSSSTSTPVNTNDSKKLGSPLALLGLVAALMVF